MNADTDPHPNITPELSIRLAIPAERARVGPKDLDLFAYMRLAPASAAVKGC